MTRALGAPGAGASAWEQDTPPYLGEEVDFEAGCFAGLGLPVVQVVSHRQHKLQRETPVSDWPVTSSTYILPSPFAPAFGSQTPIGDEVGAEVKSPPLSAGRWEITLFVPGLFC